MNKSENHLSSSSQSLQDGFHPLHREILLILNQLSNAEWKVYTTYLLLPKVCECDSPAIGYLAAISNATVEQVSENSGVSGVGIYYAKKLFCQIRLFDKVDSRSYMIVFYKKMKQNPNSVNHSLTQLSINSVKETLTQLRENPKSVNVTINSVSALKKEKKILIEDVIDRNTMTLTAKEIQICKKFQKLYPGWSPNTTEMIEELHEISNHRKVDIDHVMDHSREQGFDATKTFSWISITLKEVYSDPGPKF